MTLRPALPALFVLLHSLAPQPASAQGPDNVLLVVNAASPASAEVGSYYASKRGIPATNVLQLTTTAGDAMTREAYERTIEAPISLFLTRHNLQDQILFIVLARDIPLRVNGTGGRNGTVASVDSELTLLYRKLVGEPTSLTGQVDNPAYLGDDDPTTAEPLTRHDSDIYMVTRLDGYTVDDAKALIDRSVSASPNGAFVLDQKATITDAGGDRWLKTAADRLATLTTNNTVVLEESRAIASATGPVIGYYSWGSNDPANQLRRTGLTFGPGAVGGTFVSTDGRTLVEPPVEWTPSVPSGGPVFRGSFQSLAADLIRDGLTGVSANVTEPFLDGTVRPQILFPLYARGFTLGEAYYRAIPYLSWQTVVFGDPLCRPFPGAQLAPADIARGVDPESEMPALFTERRLKRLAPAGDLNPTAVKMLLRKDARLSRDQAVDVEALLLEATTLEPRFVAAHAQLAAMYELEGAWDRAIERYRRILDVTPDDVIALNNLAYNLADRVGSPKEALPFAERAYRVSEQAPLVTDTLGWVYHKLGDNLTAAAYLEAALRALPNHPDVLIHTATVHVALNDFVRARAELQRAERLGEPVTSREDFQALAATLLPQ